MDKIEIEIVSAAKVKLELRSFPELTSERKLVGKGLRIIRQYLPGLMRYISKQKVLAHLQSFQIEVIAQKETDLTQAQVHHLLKQWLRRKKNRRLAYMAIELILMPFSAVIALLPGPNVAFYLLFVLFYFHLKAFLNLRKIGIEDLNIILAQNKSSLKG